MDVSKDLIVPYNEQIVGYVEERVDTKGYVDLRTCLRTECDAKELKTRFLLVEASTSYNVLIGKPCLNTFGRRVSPSSHPQVSIKQGYHLHHAGISKSCSRVLFRGIEG